MPRFVRLVKLDSGEMSDMLLLLSHRSVRLVAVSSPVKSVMLASWASSLVKNAISVVIMVSPDGLPESLLNFSAEVGVGGYLLFVRLPSRRSKSRLTKIIKRNGKIVSS